MTTYNHPYANKLILSTRLETPNPGIPYRVLVVEANIPTSEGLEGYDRTKLESLLNFVSETMRKVRAEKSEIFYPLNDRYIEVSQVRA